METTWNQPRSQKGHHRTLLSRPLLFFTFFLFLSPFVLRSQDVETEKVTGDLIEDLEAKYAQHEWLYFVEEGQKIITWEEESPVPFVTNSKFRVEALSVGDKIRPDETRPYEMTIEEAPEGLDRKDLQKHDGKLIALGRSGKRGGSRRSVYDKEDKDRMEYHFFKGKVAATDGLALLVKDPKGSESIPRSELDTSKISEDWEGDKEWSWKDGVEKIELMYMDPVHPEIFKMTIPAHPELLSENGNGEVIRSDGKKWHELSYIPDLEKISNDLEGEEIRYRLDDTYLSDSPLKVYMRAEPYMIETHLKKNLSFMRTNVFEEYASPSLLVEDEGCVQRMKEKMDAEGLMDCKKELQVIDHRFEAEEDPRTHEDIKEWAYELTTGGESFWIDGEDLFNEEQRKMAGPMTYYIGNHRPDLETDSLEPILKRIYPGSVIIEDGSLPDQLYYASLWKKERLPEIKEIIRYKKDKRKRERKNEKKKQELYDKYGKEKVDAAIIGDIRVGFGKELFQAALDKWTVVEQGDYKKGGTHYLLRSKLNNDQFLHVWWKDGEVQSVWR